MYVNPPQYCCFSLLYKGTPCLLPFYVNVKIAILANRVIFRLLHFELVGVLAWWHFLFLSVLFFLNIFYNSLQEKGYWSG